MFFEINEKLHDLNINKIEAIPLLNKTQLSYDDFFQNFMLQNKPCIIKNITEDWNSTKCWVTNNCINFDHLRTQYSNFNVSIYNCLEKEFNSQKCYNSTLSNYLDYFQGIDDNAESYNRLDYLKNWHLKLNTNDDFYEVPFYFASDWLNEYCVNCLNDDYRFVYIGPKNTWTPFHVDVFTSFSWSANVCGKKKWIFVPPGEEEYLKDPLGNLPYDIHKENTDLPNHFEVIQEAGDVIFVPSGWHHQVWNLDHTISINHNWINGCNIKTVFDSLNSNLESIVKEIEDCKDMDDFEAHCQLMLSSLFGMDFCKFYEFIKYIALCRIEMLQTSDNRVLFHGHQIGNNHIKFDLNSIKNVLKEFINNEIVHSMNFFGNVDVSPIDLLNLVENILHS